MFANIQNIWLKELMDTIRDRKAFSQALIMPLFLGVLYAVMNPLLASMIEARAAEPVTVSVQGMEYADDSLLTIFKQYDITLEPFAGDMQTAVQSGQKSAGIIIPQGFKDQVGDEQPADLTLLTNPTAGGVFGGDFSVQRVELALSAYNRAIVVHRLETRALDPSLLAPINLDNQDLSTPAQRAGVFAALMLPILLGVVAAQGGLFIAIDVTAGEKERGTLEALLVTPTSDWEIFVGKLTAVFTMTSIPIVLTLLGFWAASNMLPESVTHGAVLPFQVVGVAILLDLPLALFLNVVLMMMSIRTKTFKDAQSSASPFVLVVTMGGMMAAFLPPTNAFMYLIPIYGTAAVVGKVAISSTFPMVGLVLSVVGCLLASVIGIVFALQMFNRERLLYSM